MRQNLSAKNVKRLADRLGLPIVKVMVRGGTDHRQDLCLEDGSIVSYWPATEELCKGPGRWKPEELSSNFGTNPFAAP